MGIKLVERFKEPAGPFAPKPYSVTYDWKKEEENTVGGKFNRDRVQPAVQQVRSVTKPIEDQYTKAQKRNKQTATLQLALWNKGFFKGLKDRKGRTVTYNTAVDGISGTMTKAAMKAAQDAGYIINKDGSLSKMSDITGDMVKNASAPKTTPRQETQAPAQQEQSSTPGILKFFSSGYSTNIPFLTAASDLAVATGNRMYRAVTGKGNDEYLFKNPDITDIPQDQKDLLIKFYQDKKKRTGKDPDGFYAADWRALQGNYTGGQRGLRERAFTTDPYAALEHSLGQWNYYRDDAGNVHAVDVYDWNDGETSANQGSYTSARDFMGEYGTKQSERIAQMHRSGQTAARRMDINLGNIQ